MIRIKPHHFIDIITCLGDPPVHFEPHPYGHDVHGVAQRILADQDVLLCMELGADDICLPCVHNQSGRCDDVIDISFRPAAPAAKETYNQLIDRRWCARLKIGPGDQLTARQFVQRLAELQGGIEEIYCETPTARTRERWAKLRRGVAVFLDA